MVSRCRLFGLRRRYRRECSECLLPHDQIDACAVAGITSMTLNLVSITLREIHLPLKEPFRISSGVVSDRRMCLLELADADGTVGWSECVAGEQPNYSAETIDTAWHAMKEWLLRRVLDVSIEHPERMFALLDRNIRGNNMAKAA